jgi:hypothetical protein
MTINEYVATTARAFMAAEIPMAAVNCGVAEATRPQAEKLPLPSREPRLMMC